LTGEACEQSLGFIDDRVDARELGFAHAATYGSISMRNIVFG
jgi:hypothetical protein